MAFARCLALIVSILAAPVAARAEPPVWVVSDADSTLVLFGSVHVLPQGLDWKPAVLTEALASADDIWFEIPMDDAARLEASRAAMAEGMLPKGQTLSKSLTRTDAARLRRIARDLHVPMKELDRLQPWLADVVISAAQIARLGGRTDEGVEGLLWKTSPATAKRRAFETPQSQVAIFSRAPRTAQIAALNDTLRTIEKDPAAFNRIVGLWMAADIDGLTREAVAPIKAVSPALYRALIQRRNIAWSKSIAERLSGSGQTVVVVGVGHLVGPDSVPALLRARGFKVEGP